MGLRHPSPYGRSAARRAQLWDPCPKALASSVASRHRAHEGLPLRVPIGDKSAPQWEKAEIDLPPPSSLGKGGAGRRLLPPPSSLGMGSGVRLSHPGCNVIAMNVLSNDPVPGRGLRMHRRGFPIEFALEPLK